MTTTTTNLKHKATVPGYHREVWYSDHAITNIIALRSNNLIEQYLVTYDSRDRKFVVHRSALPNMEFKMHESGLHYYDPRETHGPRATTGHLVLVTFRDWRMYEKDPKIQALTLYHLEFFLEILRVASLLLSRFSLPDHALAFPLQVGATPYYTDC